MCKLIKKRYDILVSGDNKTITKTFELDKNIKSVKGVLVTSDKDDLLYYRGTQKIEINSEEYFPENYESKLLMSGVNVAPKQRFYDLENVPAGNGIIKMSYTDADDGRTLFEAYRVSLYVNCEIEEEG